MQDLGNTDDEDYEDYWSYQETHVLVFDDIDNLLALADSLKVSDLASSVYYYKQQFYLKLAFMDENYAEIKPADAWAIANEFGRQVSADEFSRPSPRPVPLPAGRAGGFAAGSLPASGH